jgi:hypothetical protein
MKRTKAQRSRVRKRRRKGRRQKKRAIKRERRMEARADVSILFVLHEVFVPQNTRLAQ